MQRQKVSLFVIHSGVLPFSRYLFKCFIIFLWTFVNYLIQNPYTLPRSHTFHFGNLPNCCLNLTSSTMISSYLLLSITLSLTSLIHSVLLLCSTFWDQTWLQNFLLSAPLGFTTFWLISPSPPPPSPNLFKQEFLVALTKPGLYKLIISFIILLKLGGFNFNSLFCFFDDHMKAFILHIVLSFKICFYSIVWQFDSVPLL